MTASTYFKRYRMEILLGTLPRVPLLERGFGWLGWSRDLLDVHAEIKYQCFRDEIDTAVFPALSSLGGCRDLMRNIATRADFVPEATWLIVGPYGPCATVQGVRDQWFGAIQNLGVAPEQRGRGLGRALLLQALHGFRRAGLKRAYLEVTARNETAVRLYRQLGFRCTRTIYKPAPAAALQDDCVVI